MVVAELPFDYL